MTNQDSIIISDCIGSLPVEPETAIPAAINAFTLRGVPTEEITYAFDSEEVGKSHKIDEVSGQYEVSVDHSEEDDGTQGVFSLVLTSPDGTALKHRSIPHGESEDYSLEMAVETIESQIWTWAIRIRQRTCHPVQHALEELGIINQHPPGELPYATDEWHYTVSTDPCSRVSNTNGRSRGRVTSSTRFTYHHSTESGSWHDASLNVSFYHDSPNDDTLEGSVVGAYIYISYHPIKPIDERINNHDAKDIVRDCIHHDTVDEAITIEDMVDIVEESMEELVENAEALDDEHRLEIIEEAKKRWDPETETYRNQSCITAW